MDWFDILKKMLPGLGDAGIKMLADKLKDISAEASEPWKKAILQLVIKTVETSGPEGVKLAIDAIEDLMEDDKVPDLSGLDLEAASDLLAKLQNAEAGQKSAVRAFLAKISEVLGTILTGILKGALTA